MVAPTLNYNLTQIDIMNGGGNLFGADATEGCSSANLNFIDSSSGTGWRSTASASGLRGGRVQLATPSSDFSIGRYVAFQFAYETFGTPNNYDTLANGGMRILFFDGSGNWYRYNFGGSDIFEGEQTPGSYVAFRGMGNTSTGENGNVAVIDRNRTPDSSSGILDWTDIDDIGVHINCASSISPDIYISRINIADIPQLVDGDAITPGNFAFLTSQQNFWPNFASARLFKKNQVDLAGGNGTSTNTLYGLSIGDGVTFTQFEEDTFQAVFYPSRDAMEADPVNTSGGYMAAFNGDDNNTRLLIINQSATDIVIFANGIFSGVDHANVGEYTIQVIGNTSGNCTFDTCTLFRGTDIQMGHATVISTIFDNFERVTLSTNTVITGSTIRNGSSTSEGLYVPTNPTDFSAVDIFFDNNSLYDITIDPLSSGIWTFTGITVAPAYILKVHNASAVTAITVELPIGITVSASTAGGAITILQPSVATFSAPNIADNSNYILAHRQIFDVVSADISPGADTIALSNDSNGDAPAFDTTTPNRHTLVRLVLADGATIPTTNPQIINNGTYRVLSEAAGVTTLEVTEGGGIIDFIDSGTDNGSGELLTFTAETLIAEGTTAGGTGVSETFSLSNTAFYRFKTINQDTTGGPRKTTLFIDVVGAWSAISGATYLPIVDATNLSQPNLWAVPNRIADLTSFQLEDVVVDNAGNEITDVDPVEDGADMGGLTFALEGKGFIQINTGALTKNGSPLFGALCALDLSMWGVWQLNFLDVMWIASDETLVFNGLSNIIIDNVEFDETSGNLLQIYGANIREKDGQPIVSGTTIGSIVANVATRGNVGLTETGTSGLTPSESAQLANASNTGTQNVALNTTIDANVDQLLLDVADVPTAEENADTWSNRNIDGGSNTGRLNKDAIKANRNRVTIDPNTNSITVYEEDDSTVAWDGDIVTGQRDPINSVDPA